MHLHVSLLFLSMILNLSENVLSGEISERKNFNAAPELNKELSPIIKRRRKRFTNPFNQEANRLEQCAIMYKNQEPIGILQPFRDSYRLLPVNGEQIPVEINQMPLRQPLMDGVVYPSQVESDYGDEHVDKRQYQISQYSDDRYPYIFAKFKIDSMIGKPLEHSSSGQDSNARLMHKRDLGKQPTDRIINEIKPEALDEEIKNILTDMGLLDEEGGPVKEEEKREVEDENLETGTNKINLVELKPLKSNNLSKREDSDSSEDSGSNEEKENKYTKKEKTDSHSKLKSDIEDHLPVDLYIKHFNDDTNSNIVYAEDSSVESDDLRDKREKFSTVESIKKENENLNDDDNREKRDNEQSSTYEKIDHDNQEKERATHDGEPSIEESTEAMENVEQTTCAEGDIACVEKKHSEKQKREEEHDGSRLNHGNDMSEYEKELLRQITNEISKIKEQVKREVTTEAKRFTDNDEGVSVKTQRKKRYVVNTLLDEETKAIDPLLNKDEKLVPHIRRRRDVTIQNVVSAENELSSVTPVSTSLKDRIGKTKLVTSKSTENLETQTHARGRHRRFIGMNPILNNVENKSQFNRSFTTQSLVKDNVRRLSSNRNHLNPSPGYSLRKLKQYDDDYTFLNSKQPVPDSSSQVDTSRIKRETNGDEEYEDESANSYENEPVELTDKKKSKCDCGKNGNGCKCGTREGKRDTEEDSGNADDNNFYDYTDDSSNMNNDAVEDDESPEEVNNDIKRDTFTSQSDENVNQYGSDLEKYRSKSLFQNGEYYLDLYPAVYRIAPVKKRSAVDADEEERPREKREDFNDLVSLHGGAPILKHLSAVRRRSMIPAPRNRIRRKTQSTSNNPDEQQQLINMSDEDLFGALPQSFDGGLARYKRVKRSKKKR